MNTLQKRHYYKIRIQYFLIFFQFHKETTKNYSLELLVYDKNGELFASLIDTRVHFAVPPARGTGARHSGPERHDNQCQTHQEAQRWTTGWTKNAEKHNKSPQKLIIMNKIQINISLSTSTLKSFTASDCSCSDGRLVRGWVKLSLE